MNQQLNCRAVFRAAAWLQRFAADEDAADVFACDGDACAKQVPWRLVAFQTSPACRWAKNGHGQVVSALC